MSERRKISIIILGSGDSLKKALITNIVGKDLSSLSKKGNKKKLKIYKDDTYKFICTPSNNPACEDIKELVDKHPDMSLLVVEDGFSPEDVWQQIEKLHETTGKPTEDFIVVLPLSYNLTDSLPFKFYTMEQIVREVRKLDEDRPLKATNKRSAVNLVLLGMAGTGKSASGNTILGKTQFKSTPSSIPITTECQVAETEINGICVRVIDTPDIFNDEIKSPVKKQHVTKCKQLLQSEPCVFLLVMQVGRFTDGERDILKKLEKAFGSEAKEQTVILFTRREDLQRAKKSLTDFLHSCQPELKNIVEQCGRRCVVFENNDPDQHQVEQLMQTVNKMLNKQQKQ